MASPSQPLDITEDFGQRVDLTRRIREILANYPEGTTVLKEIIQNADDAGATKVGFCLDRRKHGQDSLLFKELAAWQGPALLAYNNAQFSAEDFESISKVGGSKKQAQPWKTGRFGVGFNSVYHLSDLPSFVSGRHIVFFDPHCKFLPKVSTVNPGKRIDFVNSAALRHYKDQFLPYCVFGCDMETVYSGTIFRLPLRSMSQAAVSQLSKQYYSEEDIERLLHELHLEASMVMLFLKNVEMIDIYDWQPGADRPCLLYSCFLESPTSQVQWHRHALLRLSSAWAPVRENDCPVPKQIDSFRLNFVTKKHSGSQNVELKAESFLIVQSMEASTSRIGLMASVAAKDHGLHLLPWAAVAANISGGSMKAHGQGSNDGNAFCFLPLPVKTNLPVHINAFFELSSNRRDIWNGEDMKGMGKFRSDWNSLLLNDVVASTYCYLLSVCPEIDRLSYSLWPSGSYVEPWRSMVAQLYRNLSDCPLLHSDVDGGSWVTPAQAFFHDEDYQNTEDLACAIVILGLPLVRLPKALLEMISSYCDCRRVCPTLLRQHLRKSTLHENVIDRTLGLTMLDYVLGDIIDEEAGINLSGLPLVPLANGNYGVFGRRNEMVSYFFCTDAQYFLLEKVKSKLIDRVIPKSLLHRLSEIAEVSESNIILLTSVAFAKLLGQVLPAEWMNEDEVEWRPNSVPNHPNEIWMSVLWDYLKNSCEDLSIFESWPILPTTNGHICRTSEGLGIVMGGVLARNLEDTLVDLGCRVLRSDLQIDHPSLSKCVHPPSGPGILDAISSLASNRGCSFEEMFVNVTDDQKCGLYAFLLDPKWYREKEMSAKHLHILKSLPIFQTFNSTGCRGKNFVSLTSTKNYLPPPDVEEILLGTDFIFAQSEKECEVLTRALSVQQMERSTFFRCRVIGRIDELLSDVRNEAMLTILKELRFLSLQDVSIKDTLMHLAFVPTLSGELRSPRSLYDPRIEELHVLLNENESFPTDAFRNEEILDVLQLLGLQTVVSPDTILQSAHQIDILAKQNPEKAIIRGHLLLSYLDLNAQKLFRLPVGEGISKVLSKVSDIFQNPRSDPSSSKKFWNELASVCWCPVLVQPPHPGLPWPSVTTPLAPPRLVRPQSDLWLASASMRILDGECRSAFLSQRLGWDDSLGGTVVAAQLLELGKTYDNIGSQGMRQALATVIPKMYALLTEKIGVDELEIVKVLLEGSRWVWVGDRFVAVQEVVLNGPLHLSPYLWVIPADLAVFRELLVELGVKESLTTVDFALLLAKIASMKSGLPLDSHELKTVIWIVQHLADSHFDREITGVYVPDVRGILIPSSELTYNDAPWLLADEDLAKPVSLSVNVMATNRSIPRFIHANVSNDVADRLGVKSLRRLLLAESSDSMNVTLHGVAEAFGQHEALTTRLKHIVEMYADGPGILCELLQNSDDAGASEVSFLLDKSQFGSSSLLSPRMSDWQGPALYCFNNSVFTSKDLHAISRIGQDSKLEKPHKVGRFGLGFNSVYHFTDVPGFVSGDNLVIFDPHASHLPGISPSHPGLKINFVGRGISHQFPDQCRPYLLFGCDLQKTYPGTLFRFPLRNEAMAARSLIKQDAYSPDMVLNLFTKFQAIASEVLLFLHKVVCVTMYTREGLDQELNMIYRVERHASGVNSVYDFVSDHKDQATGKEHFYRRLQKTPVGRLPSGCQKIKITIDELQKQYTQLWIVSDCLGGKQSLEMAIRMENQVHGFVPWAGIAAKLGVEADPSRDGSMLEGPQDLYAVENICLEGRAFCFLPLPVKTGLPVHVNAYFELSSNRRDIWYGDDMAGGGKLRSDWNYCLLQEVASAAYVRLLAYAACDLGPSEEYFALWPIASAAEPWASLLRGVYVSAAELDFPVLYTTAKGGHWITPKTAVFPDNSYSDAIELGNALADAGLTLVNAPVSLVSKFHEFCPTLRYLTPQMLRNSLVRRKRSLKSRVAMLAALKYCLSDLEGAELVEKLQGLPLIPLATGLFGTFADTKEDEKIYVADEVPYSLVKETLLDRLVDRSVDSDIFKTLQSIAHSESTNIVILSPDRFKDLLPRILPSDWHRKELVYWTPSHAGHPSQTWMELLWNFLNETSADLSLFSEWPLLPTSDGHLLQIMRDSSVLKDDRWSENMISVLQKTHCFMVSTKFIIEHPQLGEYVHDATASGLLEALLAGAGGHKGLSESLINASEHEIQELRGFLLQGKWFSSGHMTARQIEVLKCLPIFKSYGDCTHVNLLDCRRFFPPDDVELVVLGDNFIHAESEKERVILSEFLGIEKVGKQEFYEEHLFKNMEKIPLHVQARLMLKLVRDFSSLAEEIPSFKNILTQLPCIPTGHGNMQTPGKLYDPRVSELHLFLDKDAFFPAEEFSEATILDVLVQLGLKQSLDLRGILDSAISVARLSASNEHKAFEMGKSLLAHINGVGLALGVESANKKDSQGLSCLKMEDTTNLERTSSLQVTSGNVFEPSFTSDKFAEECDRQFWIDLTSTSWCPVLVDAPVSELPWPKGLKSLLAPPRIVRPKSQMWHVSSSMRVLDGDFSSVIIMTKLGWLEKPNLSVLAMQLIELSKYHSDLELNCSSEAPPADIKERVERFNTILDQVIPSLYSLMEESVNSETILSLQSMLEGTCWVWVGDSFVFPKEAAFDSPSHFHPYLHIIPETISCNKGLLADLGVRQTFDVVDFVSVLQRISADMHGEALSKELLDFVVRVLEAVDDYLLDDNHISGRSLLDAVLVPDANGVLTYAKDLIYNDAPWLAKSAQGTSEMHRFVHANVQNELANRLGAKSLRYLSFVDKEMTRDLPCLPLDDIRKVLKNYGDKDFLFFDLLEVADRCKANKVHFIYDKRVHSQTSILQPNLGQFQGPALTVVFEGAELTTEEVCNLQMCPPWTRGQNNNYGAGLLSCYNITDLLMLVSNGFLYLFDPSGSILATSLTNGKASTTRSPQGKVYTLEGTDIPQRFADQFQPFMIDQNLSWAKRNVTILRIPVGTNLLSAMTETNHTTQCVDDFLDCMVQNFIKHSSMALLFLNSVEAVHLSNWEANEDLLHEHFSVKVDPACAALRNPFLGKNWRKFQFSTIFGSSNNVKKLNTIDVFINHSGNCILDKWLVVLSFGCGQTRNIALDRKYLSHNLCPVAGVAAHISRNGSVPSLPLKNSILVPLPLSFSSKLPIVVLGCFIVCHEGFRHLFPSSAVPDGKSMVPSSHQHSSLPVHLVWNQELMACVRESYIQLLIESLHFRQDSSTKPPNIASSQISRGTLKMLADQSYSLWPLSQTLMSAPFEQMHESNLEAIERYLLADLLVRPMYVQLAELPLWKLHGGVLVKATEGMFLSNPRTEQQSHLPPGAVCEFLKEHYKVFTVPCELANELQEAGVGIKVITPTMVRSLLSVLAALPKVLSVERCVELLEYCCADFETVNPQFTDKGSASDESSHVVSEINQVGSTSSSPFHIATPGEEVVYSRNRTIGLQDTGVDALDIVANFGRAFIHFGKKVVEDLSTDSHPRSTSHRYSHSHEGSSYSTTYEKWIIELKGLPCPTATGDVVRLGMTELWVGNTEQQLLLLPLAAKFVHTSCLERPLLLQVFTEHTFQQILQIKPFTAQLLSSNLTFVFPRQWIRSISSVPWVQWDYLSESKSQIPSSEWLRMFWRNVDISNSELSFFLQWPLVPAIIDSTVLIKIRDLDLVFIPPRLELTEDLPSTSVDQEASEDASGSSEDASEYCHRAFSDLWDRYPWVFSFLRCCNVAVFDQKFLDCKVVEHCLPLKGQSLGQVIRSKLLASQKADLFVVSEISLVPSDCDALFSLFATEFQSFPSTVADAELSLMRSLPIYKTTTGVYTSIDPSCHCIVTQGTFFQPQSDLCLQHFPSHLGGNYYRVLGIPELSNHDVLLRFCFPDFDSKSEQDQECILSYLYMNWDSLQHDNAVVAALLETKFVSNGENTPGRLFQPRELLDPKVSLFRKVYREKRFRFPNERFTNDRWLDILRRAGLRHTMDADILLQCAKEVEELGKNKFQTLGGFDSSFGNGEISEEVFSIATAVVDAILGNFASIYGSSFCEPLSEIYFVPAERGLPIMNEKGGTKVLASYRDVVLMRDWPLAWTCSPILTRENLVPPQFSWHSLHLQSPPRFQTVLTHLQMVGQHDGEDILAKWPSMQGMMPVEDAFLEIFKYLDKTWGSLSMSDKKLLEKVHFIPVSNGTRLCPANRIFVRLEMNLAPFVFQLPSSYLPYVKLLMELGMQEFPTFDSMKKILLQMQDACGYQHLNPNELRAVFQILNFICEYAANNDQNHKVANGAVVPDDEGRLVHAQACVYVDALGSAIVNKINTSKLKFSHPHLPEDHCIQLGIRKLSEVVVEVLNDIAPLEYTDHIGGISKITVVKKLQNKSFQLAVWTLVQDFTQEIPSLKTWTKNEVEISLLSAAENLRFVKRLYTRFVMLQGNVDITRKIANETSTASSSHSTEDLGHRVYEYIDKKNAKALLAQPPDFISISDILAVLISRLLDSPMCLPLSSLFSAPIGSEDDAMEIMRMRSHKQEDFRRSRGKTYQGITPGKQLLMYDASQIQVHPLRPYYAGEIVAWCSDLACDTSLKYGVVVEDVRAPAGQALYYVQVETGPGESQTLLSSNVFSFKGATLEKKFVSPPSQLSVSTSQSVCGSSEGPEKTILRMENTCSTQMPEQICKSSAKKVQASAVVQAINDMMAAVGFPLGLDQQSLLNQALTLQERLTAAHAALSFQQARADLAAKEAETARATWLCRICLSVEVNSLLIPCGHVMCQNCCAAVTRCPFCRQVVSKAVHLYRP